MDFYKDFPERSDAGTATTPDGGIVAGSDKLNDNDYAMIGANGTGSNSQGKGYKVKFSSIYNYLKGKFLGDSGMEATVEKRGLLPATGSAKLQRIDMPSNAYINASYAVRLASVNPELRVYYLLISQQDLMSNNANIDLFITGPNTSFNNGAGGRINVIVSRTTGENFIINGASTGKYTRIDSIQLGIATKVGGIKYAAVRFVFQDWTDADIICTGFSNIKPVFVLGNSDISGFTATSSLTQNIAASYIAERYSIDEEQALTRRMIANDPTVVEQFEAYNAYCEECKTKAKLELEKQAEEAQTEQ